jgi:deoxyribodipyrimidine photo-lyase
MSRAIVWFRNDLRVEDNEALYRAAQKFDEVLPVFIINEENLKKTDYGSRKTGSFRLKFLLESLKDLDRSLREKGVGLLVRVGDPAEELFKIAAEEKVDAIYAHKEPAWEEIKEEESLQKRLGDKFEIKYFWGKTLFHINDLPFEYQKTPDVFSNFRKKNEKYGKVRPLFPRPERLKWYESFDSKIPNLEELGFNMPDVLETAAINFKGGEEEALKRLQHYFFETEQLSKYKYTRNGLIGPDYSSKFSPWLANGSISPRQIYYQVKKYEEEIKSNVSTYWLIFELIWRDFFTYVLLKYGNKLFYKGSIKGDIPEIDDPNDEKLEAWKNGLTGIPFIDANMKELNETGFMSNRGRQNAASFLIKDLKVDWRKGAAYFEEKLIDYLIFGVMIGLPVTSVIILIIYT